MDMHFNSVVVALVGADNKPFREYDPHQVENGRRCKIIMPFDTEYKVLVKNIVDTRIKLDIEIDGTNVSGKGLIIDSKETDHIERFVDVARKFKFVKAQGQGANPDVADPTSPENGIIKIRVQKEKKPEPINISWHSPSIWNSNHYYNPTTHYYGSNTNYSGSVKRGCSPLRSLDTKSLNYSSFSSFEGDNLETVCQASTQPSNTEVGATVEGHKSNQTFGTTYWNGDDGEPMVFTFYVRGVENGRTPEEQREYEEYLRLQKKFG